MGAEQSNSPLLLQWEWDETPLAPPRLRQLENGLREAIRSGRLRSGVRLPASRALSEQLDCSRWMVVQAYEQLEAEGYLRSQVGSGTFVHGVPVRPGSRRAAAACRRAELPVRLPDRDSGPVAVPQGPVAASRQGCAHERPVREPRLR